MFNVDNIKMHQDLYITMQMPIKETKDFFKTFVLSSNKKVDISGALVTLSLTIQYSLYSY